MELSTEIFNILKGANIKLKMFDFQGNKTLDAENSARLYAYVEDFLVTIRLENDEVEVLVQAGADFSFDKHKDLLSSIKKAGHNAMAEYTIRKFDKNIVPKDFAHDTVKEDNFDEIRRLKELSGMFSNATNGDMLGEAGGEEIFLDFSKELTDVERTEDTEVFTAKLSGLGFRAGSEEEIDLEGIPVNVTINAIGDVQEGEFEIVSVTGDDGTQYVLDETDTWDIYNLTELFSNALATEDFEVNPRAGHRDQMAHPENQMGTGPGIKTKPKLRPANLGKKFPKTKPKLRPDNLGEGYARATGSMKTSYIQLPESTRLVIKHSKSVNEEVRGSRSRNIQAMFIENSAGERFRFPHKYLSGAKSMAKHVSMGGTPYDAIGESILNICNEVAQCNQFLRHVRSNKLVNEGNQDIVETIKSKLTELKNTVNSLQTVKGYDSYSTESVAIVENSENDTKEVDISDKFLYNTFKNTDMDAVLETVARIVKERDSMTDLTKQYFDRLMDMIKSKEDFKITCDPNDPEHPDNEDPVKYSGPSGAMAKLSSMLSYLAMCSKNDEAFNILSHLGSELYNLPQKHVVLMAKICKYLDSNYDANPKQVEPAESITESVLNDLRRKVA